MVDRAIVVVVVVVEGRAPFWKTHLGAWLISAQHGQSDAVGDHDGLLHARSQGGFRIPGNGCGGM